MRVEEDRATSLDVVGRNGSWVRLLVSTLLSFPGILWFLHAINTDTEDQLEKAREKREEYWMRKGKRGRDITEEVAGRERVDEKERRGGVREEKRRVECAILSPYKCFCSKNGIL